MKYQGMKEVQLALDENNEILVDFDFISTKDLSLTPTKILFFNGSGDFLLSSKNYDEQKSLLNKASNAIDTYISHNEHEIVCRHGHKG